MQIINKDIADGTLSGFTRYSIEYPSRPLPPDLRARLLLELEKMVKAQGITTERTNPELKGDKV